MEMAHEASNQKLLLQVPQVGRRVPLGQTPPRRLPPLLLLLLPLLLLLLLLPLLLPLLLLLLRVLLPCCHYCRHRCGRNDTDGIWAPCGQSQLGFEFS